MQLRLTVCEIEIEKGHTCGHLRDCMENILRNKGRRNGLQMIANSLQFGANSLLIITNTPPQTVCI